MPRRTVFFHSCKGFALIWDAAHATIDVVAPSDVPLLSLLGNARHSLRERARLILLVRPSLSVSSLRVTSSSSSQCLSSACIVLTVVPFIVPDRSVPRRIRNFASFVRYRQHVDLPPPHPVGARPPRINLDRCTTR